MDTDKNCTENRFRKFWERMEAKAHAEALRTQRKRFLRRDFRFASPAFSASLREFFFRSIRAHPCNLWFLFLENLRAARRNRSFE